MKNNNEQNQIEEQILKIKNGSRNEENLFRYAYYAMMQTASADNFARIGSSREKDEEVMRWRYAHNETHWLEAWLLMEKCKGLRARLDRMEATLNLADDKQREIYDEVKHEHDFSKAGYFTRIGEYDQIINERKTINSYGIYLGDLEIDTKTMLKIVEKMPADQVEAIWETYFEFAKFYGIDLAGSKQPSSMGE